MYQGPKYIHEITRDLWEHFIRHGLSVGFAGRIKYTFIDGTYMYMSVLLVFRVYHCLCIHPGCRWVRVPQA